MRVDKEDYAWKDTDILVEDGEFLSWALVLILRERKDEFKQLVLSGEIKVLEVTYDEIDDKYTMVFKAHHKRRLYKENEE